MGPFGGKNSTSSLHTAAVEHGLNQIESRLGEWSC